MEGLESGMPMSRNLRDLDPILLLNPTHPLNQTELDLGFHMTFKSPENTLRHAAVGPLKLEILMIMPLMLLNLKIMLLLG